MSSDDARMPETADLEAIAGLLGEDLLVAGAPLGDATAVLRRERIRELAAWLRDERGYTLLSSVTAVDYLEVEPRYLRSLVARVLRITTGEDFGLVTVQTEEPKLRAIAERYRFLADSDKAATGR